MNLRRFLILMGLATLLAWGGWAFVILNVDPEEAGFLGLVLFYITLFAALVGTLSVFGVWYRVSVTKRDPVVSRGVKISVRHAVMLSLVCVISLTLAAQNLLTWWNLLALLIVVGVAEYLFLLVQESRRV